MTAHPVGMGRGWFVVGYALLIFCVAFMAFGVIDVALAPGAYAIFGVLFVAWGAGLTFLVVNGLRDEGWWPEAKAN